MSSQPPDDQFKIKRWYRQRLDLRSQARHLDRPEILLPDRPAHYHLMYNSKVDARQGYETVNMAVRALKAVAEKHEEHKGEEYVIYYEDMPIIQLKEAKVKDRTGTFDIMVQVGECHSPRCRNIARVQTAEERQ